MKLTRKDIFLALAKEVPDPKGGEKLVANPYKTWKDVNPALPDDKDRGARPAAHLRDPGCLRGAGHGGGAKKFDWLQAMEKPTRRNSRPSAHTVREDGAYVEAGENDNLIVQKLDANPDALGIFGFSFLDQNTDKIQGSSWTASQPTFEAIADGKYPVSRPLFFYVKKAHVDVIPGMKEYLAEFTSEKAWGEDGYLSEKGLIPMPDAERKHVAENVKALKTLAELK